MRYLLFVLVSLLVFGSSSIASAQDDDLEPGPNAAAMLPEAALFGQGWTQVDIVSPDAVTSSSHAMSPDVFSEGAAGVYVGPDGSRALIVQYLLTENRVAVRTSWELVGDVLNYFTFFEDVDYGREDDLALLDPPAGCLEARRTEGFETGFLTPFGGTICAPNDDSLLLVLIYGTVNDQSGVDASDSVVEQIAAP